MMITRVSRLSGIERTRDVPVQPEDFHRWESGGALIQDAMPYLPAPEREFLMSGITPDEWVECFGTGDHDDDPEPTPEQMAIIAESRLPKGVA
jgi:hypothetical protein